MTLKHDPHPHPQIAKRPIAVIGHLGMLGRAWCALLADLQIPVTPLNQTNCNITDPNAIAKHLTDDHQWVVNCAAWTDVDGAEAHEAAANTINGQAVALLAEHCRKINATLVHYSTDYVFDGQADHPYPVDHPRQPINAYGRSKLRGEQALESSGADYLLIRTSWLYAPWSKNFVRTIARAAQQRDVLRVVNDQRGRPTSAEHLAAASLKLIAHGCGGTFHITDGGECTWFDFATAIAAVANPRCTVQPCTTADFPTPARRPAYSVLDLTKTQATLGPMPHWQTNLANVLPRLEHNA